MQVQKVEINVTVVLAAGVYRGEPPIEPPSNQSQGSDLMPQHRDGQGVHVRREFLHSWPSPPKHNNDNFPQLTLAISMTEKPLKEPMDNEGKQP